MPSTRSKSSSSIDTDAKSKIITRNTTCRDVFSHEELQFVCKNCEADINVLSFSKKKKCRNKTKHHTRKCDQAWNESYATKLSRAIFHVKICKYLNIETNVTLEEEYKYSVEKVTPSKITPSPEKYTQKESNTSTKSTYQNTPKHESSLPSTTKNPCETYESYTPFNVKAVQCESNQSSKNFTHHTPKTYDISMMMHPLMLSSMNYLAMLTPEELHNCVTLHKQSMALMQSNMNVQTNHVNKKQKTLNSTNYEIKTIQRSLSRSSLSTLSNSSEEKSHESDKTSN